MNRCVKSLFFSAAFAAILCFGISAQADQIATVRTCQQLTTHYVFGKATNTTCDAYVDVPVAKHSHQRNTPPVYIGPEEYLNSPVQNTLPPVSQKNKSCFELRQAAKNLKANDPAALAEIKRKPCRQIRADADLTANQSPTDSDKPPQVNSN